MPASASIATIAPTTNRGPVRRHWSVRSGGVAERNRLLVFFGHLRLESCLLRDRLGNRFRRGLGRVVHDLRRPVLLAGRGVLDAVDCLGSDPHGCLTAASCHALHAERDLGGLTFFTRLLS